jgi:hypothetical protein
MKDEDEAGGTVCARFILHPSAFIFPAFTRAYVSNDGVRAAQDHRDVLDLAALDGDVPGVVARGGVLLVAGFVLFIDDDHAEVPDRRETPRSARPRRPARWPVEIICQ